METLKNTIFFLLITFFITGCTTKAKIVDGQRYTQTWGSNEWQYAGEIKPAEQNAFTPEESISYTLDKLLVLSLLQGHILSLLQLEQWKLYQKLTLTHQKHL